MGYRIHYQYTEYKDYPEATAISESRARNAAFNTMLYGFGIIVSIICLCVDFLKTWPMIFVAVFCILALVYHVRYYDIVTQKKIRKAIADRDKMMDEIRNPTYECKKIKIVMKQHTGNCYMCKTSNVDLFLCDIKHNKKSNSVIPVCETCIDRFKSNIPQ